ncbi:assimilatory sulfite reductase (NADPH) flavoprotein subunit [Anoxybacillus sp. LAT_35]|uniref:assimilatory sulfite reductase (NADPH) flavoprotein subunit n=1 Tax=unclassified Anoxybacillus TaxID=2639704 RepID=UPI001ED9C759|nr:MULTISPECIES: assimilatory sulfite reductase (NADPH) flavoprotein subunit [unclassified Anoxybacillus]MCG5026079.1 assimilatory sulfite reductase (NADPH) flavoprotein subunit [Anoxybacillus flavithermus]MCG3084200.1 assimilatory sulfite reductase (NADPH) flavoprotein subunit [Anoxybacillus sp. LAT27]MCG6170571.1 assimilatory sulfite reductase (NADPH) flavoprotein subunit [Anoxybacillus sp. LAT_11]MCG6174712.1 assimilatory sulfite reductase (NADPH) flavoprotein subunit [Anoxybacillus sp. LAT_
MLPFQVTNSPFNEKQVELLNQLWPTLTSAQKLWLSGYLAATEMIGVTAQQEAPVSKEVTVLYGSQTGNAQKLAEKVGETLKNRGFHVTVSSMLDFKPNELKKIDTLLIVVSTYGEGEPPDNALSFYEFLHSKRAPKLDHLRFSVLALGDTSYEHFCKTGKDFDKRLEELGGTRLYERVDCDVDYEESATKWLDGVLNELNKQGSFSVVATPSAQVQPTALYSRKHPFQAEVLENINLNGRGSNKETRHIELSLEGSGLVFEPGDALGIFPKNDPELVDLIIQEMKWNPDTPVSVEGKEEPLREVLLSRLEITVLTEQLLQSLASFSRSPDFHALLSAEQEAKRKEYIKGRDVLDVLREFGPWEMTPEQFVSSLRKLQPRFYSIASSLAAYPEEVHITVGAVRYEAHGRLRKGVCSTFCAERLHIGDKLPVFIHHNPNFKLPKDANTPIIMIGPGTGVAPFRSFLQEREAIGAKGKSWLFFGDQHFVTDFLYQTEWQAWLKNGVLTKMDVAFSRDTDKKVYVQHRMIEQSKQLFRWLQDGAVVYVCGDKQRMARDVHETLIHIIAQEGNMTREQAEAYIADMQQQKRYQRDVY